MKSAFTVLFWRVITVSHAASSSGPGKNNQAYHKPGLRSLRTLLAISFGAFTLALALVLSLMMGENSFRQVEKQIGLSLAELAFRVQDRLGGGVVERLKALQLAAGLAGPPPEDQDGRRLWLARLEAMLVDFDTVGYADGDGRLLVSGDGQGDGLDVSHLAWFLEGQNDPYVGEPGALWLAAESPPLLDLAVPLPGPDGDSAGVLWACLSRSWVSEIEQVVLKPLGRRVQMDLLMLNYGGEVLLGPEQLQGKTLDLPSIRSARLGASGYRVEAWPDGKTYLIGHSRSNRYGGQLGLGWLILVRQDLDIAYSPARQLQTQVLGGGVVLGLVFALLGWLLARYITRPLLVIARAADRIRRGDNTVRIPLLHGFSELKVLSHSLNTLVSNLTFHEGELARLNTDLERRVHQRTQQLQLINETLEKEITDRRRAEREREQLIAELQTLAETDALTGVLNRRAFFLRGEGELSRAQRLNRSLAMLMLDIDHFKGVNDTYGHGVGDQVIKMVAKCCRATLREFDLVGRYGGEEFSVLLLEVDNDAAHWVAERLRMAIQNQILTIKGGQLSVTVSLGLAGLSSSTADLAGLLHRADQALYQAKRTGRNRVVVFQADAENPSGDHLASG